MRCLSFEYQQTNQNFIVSRECQLYECQRDKLDLRNWNKVQIQKSKRHSQGTKGETIFR